MAFDWAQVAEDPGFNIGLGLLAGAPSGNPFGGAAEQMNRMQALRQNRQAQQMHARLYEAQAQRAQAEEEARRQAMAQQEQFRSQYNPQAPIPEQMQLGVRTGAIPPQDALFLQFRQAEQNARGEADRAARAEALAQTLDQKREAAQQRQEAQQAHERTLMALGQLRAGMGADSRALRDELTQARIENLRAGTSARQDAAEQKAALGTAKQVAARATAEFSLDQTSTALDRLKENVLTLKSHPGLSGITGVRGAWVPDRVNAALDPKAGDAAGLLEGLKAKTSLEVLNSFRAMSKTGGSIVGPASDRDMVRAENYLAGLDRTQSKEAFQAQLDKIVEFVDEAKPRYQRLFSQQFGGAAAPVAERKQYQGKWYTLRSGADPKLRSSWSEE